MDAMQKTFDRAAEDLGNAIHLEHVNVTIPDQRIASLFYGAGLGLTRDPYLQVMDDNMWMNVGRSQFHLPTGKAAGAARQDRHRHRRPRGAAEAARHREAEARRHQVRLRRAQRLRPGDLPVGQHHPPARARRGAVRPHQSRHSLCRVRRAGRHRQGHRQILPRDDRRAGRGRERRRHHRQGHRRQEPASAVPRDRQAAAGLRRASRADLRRQLLRPAQAARRARPRQPRGQPVPVPLPRHHRSRHRQAPVHHRARGAKPDASDVPAPAGQPQPGADRAQLRQRLRPGVVGDGAAALRRSAPTPRRSRLDKTHRAWRTSADIRTWAIEGTCRA